MSRQGVEDHDIAAAQRRPEHLLGICEEPLGRRWAVEHHRGGHAGEPERTDEGGRLPVPVRDRGPQTLSARRPPMQAGHLGACSGLVDEHQRMRVGIELARVCLAPAQDIGTILLGGMPGLFSSVIRRRWKKRHRRDRPVITVSVHTS